MWDVAFGLALIGVGLAFAASNVLNVLWIVLFTQNKTAFVWASSAFIFALLAAPVCFVPAPRLPAHGVAAPASAHVRMGVDPATKLWTPDDILWTAREEQEKARVGARVTQKDEHQKQREVLAEEAKHKAAASRVPLPPPPVETLGAQRSAQSGVAAKKFRAVRHTVGASVRFTQAQGFLQQQDFTPPVNVHREEREATR